MDHSNLITHPAHELAESALGTDPAVAVLAIGANAPVGCRRYTALLGTGSLDVPLFLTCPTYRAASALRRRLGDTNDYTSAARYSTNSGTAIGATRTEAIVHGLAELVERDAFSLLLVRTFLVRRPRPLKLVDPRTLPDDVRHLHAYASRDVPVHLIDMTTDVGVPAYCAFAGRAHGEGASLSSRYALQRALSELLQMRALTTREHHPAPDLGVLTGRPRLLAAARLEFAARLAGAERVTFIETEAPATPEQHAERLATALETTGHRPYAATVQTAPNGVCTVSVFAPGLERFFAITTGLAVVPGPRGLRHFADETGVAATGA